MPYKLDSRVDIQKQLDAMRKDFDEKLKEKEAKYQEEIKKEVSAKEKSQEDLKKEVSAKGHIQKMLDEIKGKQIDNIVDCPTCGEGHVHKMQGVGVGGGVGGVSSGGVSSGGIGSGGVGARYKCTGPNCAEEYVLVDPASDYECKDCGSPFKKPVNEKIAKDVTCPFCNGTKMVKFDWKAKFEKIKKSRDGSTGK